MACQPDPEPVALDTLARMVSALADCGGVLDVMVELDPEVYGSDGPEETQESVVLHAWRCPRGHVHVEVDLSVTATTPWDREDADSSLFDNPLD